MPDGGPLASSGTADGAHVLAARDTAAGPLPVLFFAPRDGRVGRPTGLAARPSRSVASRTMSWHWRLEDPAGAVIDPASVGVEVSEADNQGDAESWLGEHWRTLLARGVATVTLFDGDEEVYGPMGLAAT